MRRTLLFIVGGLLLGGVIHLAIVLLVPMYASHDAFAEMGKFGVDRKFHVLPVPEAGSEAIPGMDPRMLQAECRFRLTEGPLRVSARMPDDFWSVAVFDRHGRNVYSLNDRATEGPDLQLAVVTTVQLARLRQNPPPALDAAIAIELPINEGFVLLRVFVSDPSMLPRATAALTAADCSGQF
jgi:uncharacterized membrane protein